MIMNLPEEESVIIVSTDTFRTDHIAFALLEAMSEYGDSEVQDAVKIIMKEIPEDSRNLPVIMDSWWMSEDGDDLLDEVENTLNNVLPDNWYLGHMEGDAACICLFNTNYQDEDEEW